MPAISAARPGRASTPIAPDHGVGGGFETSPPDPRNLRCDKDVAGNWSDNVAGAYLLPLREKVARSAG